MPKVEQKTISFPQEDTKFSESKSSEAPIRSHIPRRFHKILVAGGVKTRDFRQALIANVLQAYACFCNSSEVKLRPASHGKSASTA